MYRTQKIISTVCAVTVGSVLLTLLACNGLPPSSTSTTTGPQTYMSAIAVSSNQLPSMYLSTYTMDDTADTHRPLPSSQGLSKARR